MQLRWSDWLVVGMFAVAAVAADCAVGISASHAIITLAARCARGQALSAVLLYRVIRFWSIAVLCALMVLSYHRSRLRVEASAR